jgi:hypothetical protein
MRAQPLRNLLEAVAAAEGWKAFSGTITDSDALLRPEALERLDARHRGSYVLFLADPEIDKDVYDYVTGGSLSSDAGRSILALVDATPPHVDDYGIEGLGQVADSRPLIEFARSLFPQAALVAPGALVMSRLARAGQAVYIPLGAREAPVDQRVRNLLFIIAKATDPSCEDPLDVDALGRSFAARGIAYVRAGRISPAEAFLRMLRALWDRRRDLSVLVKIAGKVVGGGSIG